ncbi:unnamed protein product [Protopolystoma xenopodis]|uniref:Uncharacterized protein n=1 Tax=Protopolystoma xenopodis TaxID=117903 RepID=A0A448XCI6_9PLAT|nr:unnamed protein product [Protopolystoma xenopodis]
MIPCSVGVRHMTDESSAPFHRTRMRLPQKQRDCECSSKANRQLVKKNPPLSSGGIEIRISSLTTFTRDETNQHLIKRNPPSSSDGIDLRISRLEMTCAQVGGIPTWGGYRSHLNACAHTRTIDRLAVFSVYRLSELSGHHGKAHTTGLYGGFARIIQGRLMRSLKCPQKARVSEAVPPPPSVIKTDESWSKEIHTHSHKNQARRAHRERSKAWRD